MNWIGLTGSLGSGKSTVAKLLQQRGHPVVDADQMARQTLSPGSPAEQKVFAAFGRAIQDDAGQLDRKKLADVVFRDSTKLRLLEAIIHPLVRNLTGAKRQELEKAGHRLAFYDVPLLFEKQMEPMFDGIVVVYADLETCIERVMARNHTDRADVEARIRNQLAMEEKIKKAHWVVSNTGTQEDLEKAVDKVLDDISRKFHILK